MCAYVHDNALVSVFNGLSRFLVRIVAIHSKIVERVMTIDVNANDKFPQTRFSHYENCELIDLLLPSTVAQLMRLFSRYL